MHEEEAAQRIASAAAGQNLILGEPGEGKVNMTAKTQGLLKVDVDLLELMNDIPDVMLATVHGNQVVAKDQSVAGTRVIPLIVPEECVHRVEEICEGRAVIEVKFLRSANVGLIVTRSEVYEGLIIVI